MTRRASIHAAQLAARAVRAADCKPKPPVNRWQRCECPSVLCILKGRAFARRIWHRAKCRTAVTTRHSNLESGPSSSAVPGRPSNAPRPKSTNCRPTRHTNLSNWSGLTELQQDLCARQSKEPRACRAERLRLLLLDAEAMKLLAESSPVAGMSSRPGRIRQRSSEHLPKVAMARVSASRNRQAMPFAVSLPAGNGQPCLTKPPPVPVCSTSAGGHGYAQMHSQLASGSLSPSAVNRSDAVLVSLDGRTAYISPGAARLELQYIPGWLWGQMRWPHEVQAALLACNRSVQRRA